MPRKRTISPEFWSDEKLVTVSRDARLLFIGLLNFADDNGNFRRSPIKIKAQVFPLDSDISPDSIGGMLDELTGIGVIREYSVNGENYLNIKNLLKHQQIQHPSNTTIPLNEDSMRTTPEKSRVEKSRVEDKPNIFSLYEKNIGMIAPLMADELKQAEKDYPFEWIVDAFKEAVDLNKRSWRYIQRILERWKSEGKGGKKAQQDGKPFHCADCGRGFDTEEQHSQHLWNCRK